MGMSSKEQGKWPSYNENEDNKLNNITSDRKASRVPKHQKLATSGNLMLIVLSKSDLKVVATVEKTINIEV